MKYPLLSQMNLILIYSAAVVVALEAQLTIDKNA